MTYREVTLVFLVALMANIYEYGYSASLNEFASIIDVEFEIPNTHAQVRTSKKYDLKRVTETEKTGVADTDDGLKMGLPELGLDEVKEHKDKSGDLQMIRKQLASSIDISFSAKLGTSIADISPWNTVVFDKAITNNGNGYNTATGIFTVPITGTYYFSSTILTKMKSTVEMSLRVNEKDSMLMYACATTLTYNSATNSIIVKLNKDDKVKIIKYGPWGSRPFYIHRIWSTFTGFLL
ncbi:heavy metal-binding protein HIP-like [Mytilus galloprovincialis]|uniref:heavy metal-binding protein HIP-like n=1 Tax=Mytilus galloprovincialis TaxID=29158 RepID=UPI003F7C990E